MKYIILNPEQTRADQPTFWRADNCGYTTPPFVAGIYTEEQVKGNLAYYNNGVQALAIPLTDEAMYRLGFNCSVDLKSFNSFLNKSK